MGRRLKRALPLRQASAGRELLRGGRIPGACDAPGGETPLKAHLRIPLWVGRKDRTAWGAPPGKRGRRCGKCGGKPAPSHFLPALLGEIAPKGRSKERPAPQSREAVSCFPRLARPPGLPGCPGPGAPVGLPDGCPPGAFGQGKRGARRGRKFPPGRRKACRVDFSHVHPVRPSSGHPAGRLCGEERRLGGWMPPAPPPAPGLPEGSGPPGAEDGRAPLRKQSGGPAGKCLLENEGGRSVPEPDRIAWRGISPPPAGPGAVGKRGPPVVPALPGHAAPGKRRPGRGGR